jgi:hypothetical protein
LLPHGSGTTGATMNLFNLFSRFYNVDSILNSFNKHAVRLEKAVAHHNTAAANARAEANRLAEQADVSVAEAKRASRAATKIKDLIS